MKKPVVEESHHQQQRPRTISGPLFAAAGPADVAAGGGGRSMGVSLRTALLCSGPDVYASAGAVRGRYAFEIWGVNTAPSGFRRERLLASSDAIYDAQDAALDAGNRFIAHCRANAQGEGE